MNPPASAGWKLCNGVHYRVCSYARALSFPDFNGAKEPVLNPTVIVIVEHVEGEVRGHFAVGDTSTGDGMRQQTEQGCGRGATRAQSV